MVLLGFAATAALIATAVSQYAPPDSCSQPASRLHIQDGSYDNRFYSDCHSSAHVLVTSPRAGDDLSLVRPRLIVAWPAGNSGAYALFRPASGQAGTLAMRLEESASTGEIVDPIYETSGNGNPIVGVTGEISFNDSSILAVPVLGSIRAIRNYAEGGSIDEIFQNNFGFAEYDDGSASINRTWFDNITTTTLKFTPLNNAEKITINRGEDWTLSLGKGTYRFEASFNYPQLEQLAPQQVLNEASQGLIAQNPDQTTSLSFLSYKGKLLAGTWRFLTYFGRDSMISLLLMQSVLSQDAIEAAIGAVLERIDRKDGTVCHEEVIGDFATFLNRQDGLDSSEPTCDYKMIDADFMLPITMQRYFVDTQPGQDRADAFFKTTATFLAKNKGLKYSQLAQFTAEKIMRSTAAFAAKQTQENLIHLRPGQPAGQWRDSNTGLGGGHIPYDVNVALAPAGLRAIAALSRAGFFPDHPDWKDLADEYAQVWEDNTLRFFEITVPEATAQSTVQVYAANISVPSNADTISSDIKYYGISVDDNGSPVPVMHTDDCFRHFLLNTTNQTQLSFSLDQTADQILRPFPVGLFTGAGLVVANPAFSGNSRFTNDFSKAGYHGTVIWSWQLAMMGAGLSRQLGRCADSNDKPDFCTNKELYNKILKAYNNLWDNIDANKKELGQEVWSWVYKDNKYEPVALSSLQATESNIRQLWSLTFLAVHREKFESQ